jgi:hypothetical protein
VYQATDGYFATMPAAELEREIDLTAMGFGRPTPAWAIGKHAAERGAALRGRSLP